MNDILRPAHTTCSDPAQAARELLAQLGAPAEVVTLFFAPGQDGAAIAQHLRAAWPGVKVIGCSTAGEISTGKLSVGGVSAAAMGKDLVGRAASALASFEGGVEAGIRSAAAQLEQALGQKLSSLDPAKHVGLVFLDSTHQAEEAALEALGNVAPLLTFVGGSAGDDMQFKETRALVDERTVLHGCALMVMEVKRPFRALKSCHFAPRSDETFEITKAEGRRLLEIDGRPAAHVYAEQLGVKDLSANPQAMFMNPAGVVINGEAWVRQGGVAPGDTAVTLGCSLPVGAKLQFFKPVQGLVEHFQGELDRTRSQLGGLSGMLMFECGLRRVELEATLTKDRFARAIDFPAAGFYTHGEAYLGLMHQTLTGLAFG